jgi:hypothetical protein
VSSGGEALEGMVNLDLSFRLHEGLGFRLQDHHSGSPEMGASLNHQCVFPLMPGRRAAVGLTVGYLFLAPSLFWY